MTSSLFKIAMLVNMMRHVHGRIRARSNTVMTPPKPDAAAGQGAFSPYAPPTDGTALQTFVNEQIPDKTYNDALALADKDGDNLKKVELIPVGLLGMRMDDPTTKTIVAVGPQLGELVQNTALVDAAGNHHLKTTADPASLDAYKAEIRGWFATSAGSKGENRGGHLCDGLAAQMNKEFLLDDGTTLLKDADSFPADVREKAYTGQAVGHVYKYQATKEDAWVIHGLGPDLRLEKPSDVTKKAAKSGAADLTPVPEGMEEVTRFMASNEFSPGIFPGADDNALLALNTPTPEAVKMVTKILALAYKTTIEEFLRLKKEKGDSMHTFLRFAFLSGGVFGNAKQLDKLTGQLGGGFYKVTADALRVALSLFNPSDLANIRIELCAFAQNEFDGAKPFIKTSNEWSTYTGRTPTDPESSDSEPFRREVLRTDTSLLAKNQNTGAAESRRAPTDPESSDSEPFRREVLRTDTSLLAKNQNTGAAESQRAPTDPESSDSEPFRRKVLRTDTSLLTKNQNTGAAASRPAPFAAFSRPA